MIRPPGFRGAAFETGAPSDARTDPDRRRALAATLGIPTAWASAHQVHGANVIEAQGSGVLGDADALVTVVTNLPLVVATADCLPIIVEGSQSVAVIHAGWRGLAAGVVDRTLDRVRALGDEPVRAAIGPAIGPCCFEVGVEVTARFPDHVRTTTWGTASVDLAAAASDALEGLEVWRSSRCTRTDPELRSYRGGDLTRRQVAIAWNPA